jgi:hypothetical protein
MKKNWSMLASIIMILVLFAPNAEAYFYKWVDSKGELHVTSEAPPPGAKLLNPPEENTEQPAPAPEPPKPAGAAPESGAVLPQVSDPSVPSGGGSAAVSPPDTAQPAIQAETNNSEPQESKPSFLSSGVITFLWIAGILMYLFFCLCLFEIATRAHYDNAWIAWVPGLQVLAFTGAAGRPCYWVVFLMIPVVNIFAWTYLWICICANLGKNKWLGLFSLVPLGQLGLFGYLAFSQREQYS